MTTGPTNTAIVDLGGPVHYADYGGEGEPLLVVHGLGGAYLNCMQAAPLLTDRFHVFAVDLLGFGLTPLAGRRSSMLNNRRLIGDFVARVVGAPATILGHSMGGALAMLLAVSDPGLVTRLVLVDPGVGSIATTLPPPISTSVLDVMSRRAALCAPLMRTFVRADLSGAVRRGLDRDAGPLDRLDPAVVAAHMELERRRSRSAGVYLGYLQAWRSMNDVVADIDEFIDVVVSKIATPTLLVQGADDPIVPVDFAIRAGTSRPDWRVEILPDQQHSPHMQRPAEFVQLVLDWVRSAAPVTLGATPR